MAAIELNQHVGCLSGIQLGGQFLLAAGLSNFTGTWWTGEVCVSKPCFASVGKKAPASRISGRMRSGVAGLDWLRKQGHQDEGVLVSGADDGSVDVWKVLDDSIDGISINHEDNTVAHSSIVTSIASQPCPTSDESILIASTSLDGTVMLWSLAGGGIKDQATLSLPNKPAVHSVRWSTTDGGMFVSSSHDGVRVWSVGSPKPVCCIGIGRPVLDSAIFETNLLATGDESGCLNFFDLRKPSARLTEVALHEDSLQVLAVSSNGCIATGSDDGQVMVLSSIKDGTSTPKVANLTPSPGTYIRGLAWDGVKAIYSGGWGGKIVKLNLPG